MKTKIFLLFILITIAGCKPKEVITEKVIYKVDSTSISYLQSELNKKTTEAESLKNDLERTRDEVTKLQSNASIHEINYDTTAQLKPDGYYPVAREVMTENKVVYEKNIAEKEKIITELNKNIERLYEQNVDLKEEVTKLTNENKDLKTEVTPTTGFNFRLFFTGVAVGAILIIALFFIIKFK